MLTVHLVEKDSLEVYGAFQKQILKSTEVVIADGKTITESTRQARDAAVLGRHKDVVAVVPASKNPNEPAFTTEWKTLADEVFAVSAGKKKVVQSKWF